MKKLAWFAGIVVVLVILFNMFAFTVDETEQAIVLQFGEIKSVTTEAGLYFKLPFIQSVEHVEQRLLSYDIEPRLIITGDQRRLEVNNYAIWRITNPGRFKETLNARQSIAQTRIDDIVYSDLRNVLARFDFDQVASEQRLSMLEETRTISKEKLAEYGVELLDIRIKRADLPEANEEAVYERMKSERYREATKLRSEGDEEAQRIRSGADRESRVIVAEAEREAETIRGSGEAEALEVYSAAYSQNEEFYNFWRKLQSYGESFSGGNSIMLIPPDSDYFQLLQRRAGEK